MGKVSDERFNLDWRAPLSAVQAFGIALSVFDSKMACSPRAAQPARRDARQRQGLGTRAPRQGLRPRASQHASLASCRQSARVPSAI